MVGIVSLDITLIVIKRDRPVGHVKREVAVGAVIILPTVVGFAEKLVNKMFNGIVGGHGLAVDFRTIPNGRYDFYLSSREFDDIITALGFDALNLPAIAITIEIDIDDFDARRGKHIEQRSLVRQQ